MLSGLISSMLGFFILFSSPLLGFAQESPGGLRFNEVLAAGHLTAVDGKTSDWIELYNSGDQTLDLSGYGISDKASIPYRTKLSGLLLPGEYLLLTSEKGLDFSLSREGEQLVLTSPAGDTIEELSHENLPHDVSLMRQGDEWHQSWSPTPGEDNLICLRDEVEQSFYESAAERGIIISEVMAANGGFERNVPNYDWVEFYNPGKVTISLEGLYLSSDAGNLTQWPFPRQSYLRAGQHKIVYCTGEKVKLSAQGVLVNEKFKIDKSNGAVILSDGKEIIDCVSLGLQYGNVSYGRPEGQGAFRFLNQTTFNRPNPQTGSLNRSDPVSFSVEGGYVSRLFSLQLSAPEHFLINYTLDGSEPGVSSPLYTSPLTIDKNTVVRAYARQNGWIDGPFVTHTYLFDAPLPYPIVSIAGDSSIFFGKDGIFEPKNHNNSSERRINLEIFDQGKTPVNQGVSTRLTGGTSQVYVPRTFSVYARPGLGNSSIPYNPFLDRSYSQYSCFTLRHGGTDTNRTRIRDGFLTRLARGYKLMYQASAPAAVYVNGNFWGAFNLRERTNQDSIAQWEGITDRDAINDIIIIKNRGIQIKGKRDELDALASFCRTKDLNIPEYLDHVLSLLDADSLFAHTAFEIITGNKDLSNVKYYKVPGGKWKLILFDLDLGMMDSNALTLDFYLGKEGKYANCCYGELFTSLMRVPAMRERFFTLTGRILRERFTAEELLAELSSWEAEYRPLIQRHALSWKDFGFNSWEKAMDSFRSVLARRPALVVGYIKRAFRLTDEEVIRYFAAFLEANAIKSVIDE